MSSVGEGSLNYQIYRLHHVIRRLLLMRQHYVDRVAANSYWDELSASSPLVGPLGYYESPKAETQDSPSLTSWQQ